MGKRIISGVIPALSLLLACSSLSAQNELSLGELKDGQIALNLNLTEQEAIGQDTLNASLEYVAQGRDRRELQNDVNSVMQQALGLLRRHPELEFNTSYYRVNIVQTGRPSRTDIEKPVFRAQQGLHITSRDSAALLELLAELQDTGLTMNSLYYSLSSETQESVAAELTRIALLKLREQAQSTAEVLGLSDARLVEINMDAVPMMTGSRMMRSMAADAEFAAPDADPGETMVTVRVSARAILSP